MKLRLLSLIMAIVCCFSAVLSGCGSAGSGSKVDDAVKFVKDAAKKTASAKSVTLEVTGFGSNSSNDTVYVYKSVTDRVWIDNEPESGFIVKGWSGRQTDKETTMVKEHFRLMPGGYDATQIYYDIPLKVAQHSDLGNYLKKDAKVYSGDNGVRYVSCMMYFSDFSVLSTDELENNNRPVELRFYVDKNGYLCEMQYDMAAHPDGSGDIYTNIFKFKNFNKADVNGELPAEQNQTVDSEFPKGKENSTLTAEMVKNSIAAPSYTFEDFQKYNGVIAGGGNWGASAVLSGGKVLLEDDDFSDEFKAEIEALSDIVFIDSSNYTEGVVAVKKDGTVVKAGFDNEKYNSWDLSSFTDMASVCIGDKTLYGVKKDGTVVATGTNSAAVSGWSNVKKISVFDDNVIALKNDGTVYVSGEYGVTAASGWTDIADVAAGRFHVVGLKNDGTVVAAGSQQLDTDYGERNVSDWNDIVGIAAGNMSTAGLKKDGTVVAVGYECEYMNKWNRVVYINLDTNSRAGLRSDGKIYGLYEWDLF